MFQQLLRRLCSPVATVTLGERFFWLIAGTLAVWRVTHLLAKENGPFHVIVRLRKAAGNGFWGELLDCFQCLSLWVAAPVACVLAADWREGIAFWLAWSGGAILLDRAAPAAPSALYFEEGADAHAVLRRSEDAGQYGGAAGL